eukprot:366510-Chlamydomonas_euryale.AAC.10
MMSLHGRLGQQALTSKQHSASCVKACMCRDHAVQPQRRPQARCVALPGDLPMLEGLADSLCTQACCAHTRHSVDSDGLWAELRRKIAVGERALGAPLCTRLASWLPGRPCTSELLDPAQGCWPKCTSGSCARNDGRSHSKSAAYCFGPTATAELSAAALPACQRTLCTPRTYGANSGDSGGDPRRMTHSGAPLWPAAVTQPWYMYSSPAGDTCWASHRAVMQPPRASPGYPAIVAVQYPRFPSLTTPLGAIPTFPPSRPAPPLTSDGSSTPRPARFPAAANLLSGASMPTHPVASPTRFDSRTTARSHSRRSSPERPLQPSPKTLSSVAPPPPPPAPPPGLLAPPPSPGSTPPWQCTKSADIVTCDQGTTPNGSCVSPDAVSPRAGAKSAPMRNALASTSNTQWPAVRTTSGPTSVPVQP